MSFLYSTRHSRGAERRPLYAFLIVTLAVGAAGSLFTEPSIPAWYAGLIKPAIAPPNYVFAPVWTMLYILMAFAAWRCWRKTGLKSVEMTAFGVQLALNLGWSAIFFGLHNISAALIEILALDAAILACAILFFRRDLVAGLLLLPYLGWSLFATVLTNQFRQLN